MKTAIRRQWKWILLGFLVGYAVGVGLWAVKSVEAQAAATYTWAYDTQNFYRDYGVTYTMTNLTVGADYEWSFEILDDNGLVVSVPAVKTFAATSSSTTIHVGRTEWPEDTFAPVRVTDNYGNTLTFHYLAPELPNFPNTFEWEQSNGNTAENHKQSTGSRRSTTGPCPAPPYNESLLNGWHHTARSCSTAVVPDGYTILHYRMDVADYGNGDTIQFHYISPETLDVVEFELDEIVDYQASGHGATYSIGSLDTHNFIVLNTSGEISDLPWIDGQASNAFVSGDNPMRADLPVGAYACTREDSGGTWISDCESILLVSNAVSGSEWGLNFSQSQVATHESGTDPNTQTANFQLSTSQIWDAYNGAWTFGDSEVGTIDTAVYAFSTDRSLTYDVDLPPANAGNTAIGEWRVFPASLPTDLAAPNEMFFDGVNRSTNEQPTYLLTDADEFITGIQNVLELMGFNTPSGQIIFFLLTVVVGSGFMWFAKVWGIDFPPIMHSLWFLASGSIILVTGLATGIFAILFIITAPLVVLYGIILQRNGRDSFA